MIETWVSSLANDQGTIDIVADRAKEVLFRLLWDPASKEQGITQHVLLSEKLQDAAIEACVGVSGRVAGLQTFQDPTVVSLNKLTLDNVKLSTALAINRSKLNALQKQYEVKVKREAYEARYNEKLAGRLPQAAT
ncbi:hypothetical protein DIPPA_28452 [Diplonema papillatum]|nr:hypothetical protein DIPPA_28452 [Diplonema papillatum]